MKPAIYEFLKKRMQNKISVIEKTIDYEDAVIIFSHQGIPKHLVFKILKDMESYGIIKKITNANGSNNKTKFRVL